ncbi:MAG: Gmad2 immunoglobulin-like domain-containing protein, partial [Anaerolineales bacterium]
MKKALLTLITLGLLFVACNLPTLSPTATSELVDQSPPASEALASPSDEAHLPDEAIQILEPGPGSELTSPLQISGVADPTFEQNLVVRLVLDDGTVLVTQPTTIQAELGARGPFEAEVPFSLEEPRGALVQVFSTSARDGGIVHLASVGVRLMPDGEEHMNVGHPHSEDIIIQTPTSGQTISEGVVHVEGIGLASFEGTLVIYVLDVEGNEIGSLPITVDAPDIGQPGSFSADVPYNLTSAGPGRIMVVDP